MMTSPLPWRSLLTLRAAFIRLLDDGRLTVVRHVETDPSVLLYATNEQAADIRRQLADGVLWDDPSITCRDNLVVQAARIGLSRCCKA